MHGQDKKPFPVTPENPSWPVFHHFLEMLCIYAHWPSSECLSHEIQRTRVCSRPGDTLHVQHPETTGCESHPRLLCYRSLGLCGPIYRRFCSLLFPGSAFIFRNSSSGLGFIPTRSSFARCDTTPMSCNTCSFQTHLSEVVNIHCTVCTLRDTETLSNFKRNPRRPDTEVPTYV